MKARELLKTNIEVGTWVEINKDKCMVIWDYSIYKKFVANHKAIIILNNVLTGRIATASLDQEAKIIKKVVLG